jgi:tetratricopeptide (TPR) repeat protein
MNTEQWRRVKDLFGAALHIPMERQAAFRRIGRDNLDQALATLHRALDLDDHYALAYARVSEAYERRYGTFTKDPNDAALARSNAVRAAELAPELAAVQVAMGIIETAAGEYDRAARLYQKALRSDPTDPEVIIVD